MGIRHQSGSSSLPTNAESYLLSDASVVSYTNVSTLHFRDKTICNVFVIDTEISTRNAMRLS